MEQSLKLKIFKTTGELIVLLESKITESEALFRTAEHTLLIFRNVTIVRSLKNFVSFSKFIVEKVNHDSENAYMYLLQLRALADIFARTVYLLASDDDSAVRVAVCDDLLTLKDIANEAFEEHFETLKFKLNETLFSIEGFPQTPDQFTWSGLKSIEKRTGQNLLFPNFKHLLNKSFINSRTITVRKILDIEPVATVLYCHKAFSKYVHGNHLMSEGYGTEVFWLNMHLLTVTSSLIEIVDTELLEHVKSSEIRLQMKKVKLLCEEIGVEWKRNISEKENKLSVDRPS